MSRFFLTIFVSAFLLFQVQPMIAKYILPWFGGTPAVWTTCMLFFQLVLLAGYAYSHFTTLLKPRVLAVMHISLLLVSLALLPIIPRESLKPVGTESPTWQILLLLFVTIGLPYGLLSTTGPLVQSWFAREYPQRSPYRLFALSNFGSLIALISYPFVFEYWLRTTTQVYLWSGVYVVFVALCCWTAARSVWGKRADDSDALAEAKADQQRALTVKHESAIDDPAITRASAPGILDYVFWLVLSAVPSAMLLASTSQICQEVAVIPFFWIVPLSLYLISFIICFDNPRWYRRVFFGVCMIGFIAAAIYCLFRGVKAGLMFQLIAFSGALFASCMTCHGEIASSKPASKYLTLFYLLISIGGAAGGLFVVAVAPRIFHDYWELHVCYGAAVVLFFLALVKNGHAKAAGNVSMLVMAATVIFCGWQIYYKPVFFAESLEMRLIMLVAVLFTVLFGLFGFEFAKQKRQFEREADHEERIWNLKRASAIGTYLLLAVLICGAIFFILFQRNAELLEQAKLFERTKDNINLQTGSTLFAGYRFTLLLLSGFLFLLMAAFSVVRIAFLRANSSILSRFTMGGICTIASAAIIATVTISLLKHVYVEKRTVVAQERDFYGVLKVEYIGDEQDDWWDELIQDDNSKHNLVNGRIKHGEQFLAKDKRRRPTTYYCPGSGIGVAVKNHPKRGQQPMHIGVIGLGTGTMAAWGEAGDRIRFYEINPVVEKFAREYFYYLEDSPAEVQVVLGDARVQLEKELKNGEAQKFDILVVDAFSSDAIPHHLITNECVDLLLKHLNKDGILAYHISNRFLNLDPIVYSLARHYGYNPLLIDYDASRQEEEEYLAADSSWVLITKNEEFFADPEVLEDRAAFDFFGEQYVALPEVQAIFGKEPEYDILALDDIYPAGDTIVNVWKKGTTGEKVKGEIIVFGERTDPNIGAMLNFDGQTIPLSPKWEAGYFWTDDFVSLWKVTR